MPRKVKTPKAYMKFLEQQLRDAKKQQVPWYPPAEVDPGKRAILGMKKRNFRKV